MKTWEKEFNKKFGIFIKTPTKTMFQISMEKLKHKEIKSFIQKLLIEEYKEGYKIGWEIRDAITSKRKK